MLDAALGTVGATIRSATIAAEGRFVVDDEGGAFSRFDALDTNGNGRIEWPGDWNTFTAQNLDRHGVLTWGEASRLDGPSRQSSARYRWTRRNA